MKLTIPTLVLAAFAATSTAQYTDQSPPFYLVLLSDDNSVNSTSLSACHSGAAIESLCLGNKVSISNPDGNTPPVTFNFNTSADVVTPNATLGSPGVVTYLLRGGNFNESEALGLYADPITNVAMPMFGLGSQTMAFDSNNLLNIQGYVDDRMSSGPKSGDTVAYYRWYSCATYYAGYQYVNLVWALGDSEPETPDCAKVNVKRVFV